MRRILPILAVVFIAASVSTISAQKAADDFTIVSDHLNVKTYTGADKNYETADIQLPRNVDKALSRLGINSYMLVRNEIYARHGYIFKNPTLSTLFARAKWYNPDSKVGINAISKTESRNVEFIRKYEENFDYDAIAKFLSDRYHDKRISYSSNEDIDVERIRLSLNHLNIKPSRLLTNELLARYGYSFSKPVYKKIFSKVTWYNDNGFDERTALSQFSPADYMSLEILNNREWIDIMESVQYSMPADITVIPAVGMDALFVKHITINGETFHYSSASAWNALEEKGASLDDHKTDINSLVADSVIEKIKKEQNPLRKLILYFTNKKYAGYTDTTAFNHSDMQVPNYLTEAVDALGLNWKVLLRKEIHARNGAIFIDRKIGPVFRGCPWYKARYNLTKATASRFPDKVRISSMELSNYSLLEGEEMMEHLSLFKDSAYTIAVDLMGKTYVIKTETFSLSGQTSPITLGYGFTSINEADKTSIESIVKKRMKKNNVDIDEQIYKVSQTEAVGC
ncbi:MAG TPA: YARHG domain-containing protein [Spirochaetota bacterium]|nr:YARHG domain-containing protein [Spirochaetota bacterium]